MNYKIKRYRKGDIRTGTILFDSFRSLVKDSFGKPAPDHEIERNTVKADTVLAGYINNKPIGFVSVGNDKQLGYTILGVVVDIKRQSNGIYKDLLYIHLKEALRDGVERISIRTQNPKIEKGLIDTVNVMGINYKLERHLHVGYYGRQLTLDKPYSNDQIFNSMYSLLNHNRGDAFGLIVKVLK